MCIVLLCVAIFSTHLYDYVPKLNFTFISWHAPAFILSLLNEVYGLAKLSRMPVTR